MRLLHWTLVVSVAASAIGIVNWFGIHQPAGYVALAAVLLRLVWGGVGSRYARFAQFLRGPRAALRYARNVAGGCERRFIGHNPLGGWMVVALLADAIATGLTGWLYTTDRFWGVQWVEELHSLLGHALIPLLLLHVAGAVFTSWRHRENLIAAMLHGRKPAAQPHDIA